MLKTIKGDLTQIESGALFQMVNCQNAYGRGLSGALSKKWPIIKESYHKFCGDYKPIHLLGNVNVVKITDELYVFNCFGQLEYGNAAKTKRQYVDYHALSICLKRAKYTIEHFKMASIYFPALFSCGLAGGDPQVVHKLIEKYYPTATLVEFE